MVGERYGTLNNISNDMKCRLPSAMWFKFECITICLHFKLQNLVLKMRITLSKTLSIMILIFFSLFLLFSSRAHPESFFGEGGVLRLNIIFILF